ncbi:scabin-related ADP-ribosyltransferase [Glycomyces niveus]|uniref:Pierisin-like domain-containing protein n=1 Tax=Glycomyces niveus TaxID=2820287 RepID=A0ABS3U1G7_9ACTN|nr:hypothetical protein [Glycomyces sp. NEAU-S30]
MTAVEVHAAFTTVRNLTVAEDHTFSVAAAESDFLTHNCGSDAEIPDTVYRSDTREPEEIFESGFEPLGDNMSLEEHVAGVSGQYTPASGYVSTTTSEAHALSRNGHTYTIQGATGGIDVNAMIPDNRHADEMEIAFPGAIDPSCIVGCRTTSGDWIPNPGFGRR